MDIHHDLSQKRPAEDENKVCLNSKKRSKHSHNSGLFGHTTLYNTSKQIRLLRFLPSVDAHEINVELSVWPLSQAPSYSAISYAWGEVFLRSITLNGHRFYVRWNCRYALWQARTHYPNDYIWIDSVCIDQDNPQEKSAQVAVMFDIFSKAYRVLAAVGPHADGSEELLASAMEREDFSTWLINSTNPGGEQHPLGLPWAYFETRPYWKRLWIVQELFAAKARIEVLCGHDIFPWKTVMRLCREPEDAVEAHLPWFPGRKLSQTAKAVRSLGLKAALAAFADSFCSDPRDRLYAILPLIQWPDGMKPIAPDYEKSPFELAIRLVDHLDGEVGPMLETFGISHQSSEMRKLIVDRKMASGWPLPCESRPYEAFEFFAGNEFFPSHTPIGRLTQEIDGNMTSSILQFVKPVKSLSSRHSASADFAFGYHEALEILPDDPRPHSQWESETAARKRHFPTSESPQKHIPPYVLSLDERSGPKKLFCRLKAPSDPKPRRYTVGWVCKETNPGDLIVISKNRMWSTLLVLRHNHGDHFDVVGQGVLITTGEFMSLEHSRSRKRLAELGVSFTARDKLALVGHDLGAVSRQYDPAAYFDRLHVNPIACPTCAVRIIWQGTPAEALQRTERRQGIEYADRSRGRNDAGASLKSSCRESEQSLSRSCFCGSIHDPDDEDHGRGTADSVHGEAVHGSLELDFDLIWTYDESTEYS